MGNFSPSTFAYRFAACSQLVLLFLPSVLNGDAPLFGYSTYERRIHPQNPPPTRVLAKLAFIALLHF